MKYFSEIPEAHAIVQRNGVYRQVPLYVRGEKIYAKFGAGYVRLHQGGQTSLPKMSWLEIDPGDGNFTERQGSVFFIGDSTPRIAAE